MPLYLSVFWANFILEDESPFQLQAFCNIQELFFFFTSTENLCLLYTK